MAMEELTRAGMAVKQALVLLEREIEGVKLSKADAERVQKARSSVFMAYTHMKNAYVELGSYSLLRDRSQPATHSKGGPKGE